MDFKILNTGVIQSRCSLFLWILILICITSISCTKTDKDSLEKETVPEKPLFTLLSESETGVSFKNVLPETPQMNILTYQYLHNGGGVALGDINNDGLTDLFFTANYGPNHLYLNKGGLKFEEIGRSAGVGGKKGWSTGVTMVDINNDGFLDIYVSRSGNFPDKQRANALFVNNGDLTFTEDAEKYGLDDTGYSTQATFLDFDRDGDLDMFQVNHPIKHGEGTDFYTVVNGRDVDAGDRLYRNDNGKYKDISEEAGIIGNSIGYGLSASVGDLNNDGWPDIYVTNDYLERDYLYYNNGDGTFKEDLKNATRHISNFAMGSDIADINNDGLLDIITADMVAEDNFRSKTNMSGMNPERFHRAVDNGLHYQYMMNTLQLNNGNGTFSEIAQLAGVDKTDWSWAPLFADFDNDGHKDLMMTNGLRKEARNNDFVKKKKALVEELKANPGKRLEIYREILDAMPEEKISNYIFKNNGNLSFQNKTAEWGFETPSFSNGASYADLDNDGDLDIVISNADQVAFVYENNLNTRKTQQNYLQLVLNGPPGNSSGIGAQVTFKNEGSIYNSEHYLNRGYQSSVDNVLHFGLGTMQQVDSLWVTWSDGRSHLFKDVEANQRLNVVYDTNSAFAKAKNKKSNPYFSELNPKNLGIEYRHKENDFDDFKEQVLLPHKMSTLGPGMATGDINGDGLDDIFMGGAAGQTGELYSQKADGTFIALKNPFKNDTKSEDIDAHFFDADGDNDLDLYVVSGGNEFSAESPLLYDRLYLNDGLGNFKKAKGAIPELAVSGGVVVSGDYDNDGDLDLFVGGRLVPGQYPQAASSFILQNNNGVFKDVTAIVLPELSGIGMVSTAIWTDYNNDGKMDLLIAGEWMSVLLYENSLDGFVEVLKSSDASLSLDGWWNAVKQGDFDNDGDMDYIVGNLGLNYKYKASPGAPFELYYDDFDGNNKGDIVLSYEEKGERFPLRGRECSSQQLPFIKEKFGDYESFAKASLGDILGEDKLKNALRLQATNFASVLIENRGNGSWAIQSLPREAQFSAVQDFVIKDYNKDGNLDILLAGNGYDAEVETPRNDAGNGLLLLGQGDLSFLPVSTKHSGVFMPHNLKRLAVLKSGVDTLILAGNNNGLPQIFKINN